MPFDPSLPAPNSPLQSQVIRDQLQALFVLINNIVSVTAAQVDGVNTLPAGSPAQVNVSVSGNTLHFTFELPQGQEGPMGQQGPPFANAVVDAVNTVNPGDPATVGVSFDGTNVRFTFSIPRGNDGSQGPAGNDGSQGPPFAQAVVDNVTTLDPGNPATVGVNFDGTNVRFSFGLPRGSDGAAGPPGDVSQTDLNNAMLNMLSQSSNISNIVSTLGIGVSDPPTQGEVQQIVDKLDELINVLRR